MSETARTREELAWPYDHLGRHSALAAWREEQALRRTIVASLGLIAGGSVGAAAGVEAFAIVAGVGAMLWTISLILLVVAAVRQTARLSRRALQTRGDSELGRVRAERPHVVDADPVVAHAEFAVTAEDDGRLVTWRFYPLAVDATVPEGEVEVPGRPRYAARAITDSTFDFANAVRAAEQLLEAQSVASLYETRAARETRAT